MVKVNKNVGKIENEESYTVIEDEKCFTIVDSVDKKKKGKRKREKKKSISPLSLYTGNLVKRVPFEQKRPSNPLFCCEIRITLE